jgi:hypothetical protein
MLLQNDESDRSQEHENDHNSEGMWEHTLFDPYYNSMESVLTGVKNGLPHRDKKLTQMELHVKKGHIGYLKRCPVCTSLRRNLRRKYPQKDPHKSTLPGRTWGFDLISWKTPSLNGNNYTLVMRDYSSLVFRLKHIARKSQVTEAVRAIVMELRADPRFQWERDYKLVSTLRCDPAGEQRDDNDEWMSMCKELGIEVIYGDPTDKRSDGFEENAVKMIELSAKALMSENPVPTNWWELAADQGAELRNHVPASRNIKTDDGDAACPLEELSKNQISRRACHNYIAHFVPVGTAAHVTQPVNATRGSDNTTISRHKPGILYKMHGIMPIWKSPITQGLFRSKSFLTYKTARGQSAWNFHGCAEPSDMPELGIVDQNDATTPRLVVAFDDVGRYHRDAAPPNLKKPNVKATNMSKMPYVTVCDDFGYVYETDETGEYKRTTGMIQKLQAAGVIDKTTTNLSERDEQIQLLKYDPDSFIGRSVYQRFSSQVYSGQILCTDVESKTGRTLWQILFSDNVAGDYYDDEMIKFCIDKVDGTDTVPAVVKQSRPDPGQPDEESEQVPDAIPTEAYVEHKGKLHLIDKDIREERLESADLYYCEDKETFPSVCAGIGLDKSLWNTYYDFVHTQFMMGELFKQKQKYPGGSGFNHPFQKGVKKPSFEKDKRFPLPCGELWDKHIGKHKTRSNNANLAHELAYLEKTCYYTAAMKSKLQTEYYRGYEDDDEIKSLFVCTIKANLANETGVGANLLLAPKSWNEAMRREDFDCWLNAGAKEFNTLIEKGVFSEKWYTMAQLRRMGVIHAPIPAGFIFDRKLKPDNSWDKDKGRIVIRGTKRNMSKSFGSDYQYETYSAAPGLASNRIMQACMVIYDYTPINFDIVAAYTNADILDHERVPVVFESGMREYDPDTGEQMFKLLEKNLYGAPQASRRFQEMRDEWMLEHFNKDGWTCKQMTAEKSMFKFTSKQGKTTIACIHSDDVDCVCEDIADGTKIAEAFDKRFGTSDSPGIKLCDPKFMLGCERKITVDPDTGVKHVVITQSGCVDTLYEEFKDQLPKKPAETPIPEGCFLSTYHPDETKRETDPEEMKRCNKHYKSATGSLLWLSRNCYPELSQGLHLICRVMAKPYQEAWDAVLHMISYVHGQRDRGIRFSSDGNMQPIVSYDSSNKQDPGDSKAIAGYVLYMAGGPISWQSKKAQHIGTSSSHNEYMAMFHAAKEAKWVRDLLIELDLPGNDWSQPIITLGDNDQATRWSVLGMVTTGNKTVRMNYHWVQESVIDGIIDPRRVDTLLNNSDLMTKSGKLIDYQRLVPGMTGYGDLPPIPDPTPQ